VFLGLAGCFDPTNTPEDSTGTGDDTSADDADDDDDDDDGPTTSATDPTAESGDPSGPTTTAEDSSATDPDTGTSVTDDTGSPECPAPNTCADAAPDGWSGPVVVFRGDIDAPPPPCAVPYPIPELETFGDPSVPAGDCDCECTPPNDAFCDGGTVIYNTTSATCDTPSTNFFIEDGCAEFGGEFFSIRYFEFDGSGVQIFGGDCTPAATENIPPAEHGSIVVVCGGGDEDGTCDGDQVCVPAPESPFQDRLCVWQDGDVDCPADTAYTEKELYFDTISDDRDCSTCTCGPLGGTCDDAAVIMRADAGCAGAAGSIIGDAMCAQASIGADSAELTATPNPECAPTGGVLEGDVTELGPHTICCTP
jgi:hypothetical protein